MDPITGAMIASFAASIIGGIASAEEREKAERAIQAAVDRVNALEVPDEIKNQILYQQFAVVGDFTPQSLNKTLEEYAPLALIQEDPTNQLRQEEAYNQMAGISKTGLGAQDVLATETLRRKTTQDVLAQMAALETAAKRRGQFGGGQQYAGQLQAIQSGADRQAMENLQIAANAQQRRDAATRAKYEMATGMRGTDLDVESKNVAARNLRDELAMKYSTGRELQNKSWAEEQNRLRNLAMQDTSNKNVLRSQEESLRRYHTAPLELARMKFDKARMLNDLAIGQSRGYSEAGAAKAKGWSDMGSAAATGLLAYQTHQDSKDLASAYRQGRSPASTGYYNEYTNDRPMMADDTDDEFLRET